MKRKGVMKVFIIILSILCIYSFNNVQANEVYKPDKNVSVMYQPVSKEQKRKQFEQRLNLSEKQKEKVREIHQKGLEEMKPVMMELSIKKEKLETLNSRKLLTREQKEQIEQLKIEISELEKQAKEIRKKNSQEFEKILNKSQRAELELMKAEGRARYEQKHHPRPPFQGLGTPSFLFRPLLPPNPNDNGLWK